MTIYREVLAPHGYIKLVDWWGSDEKIIEAARMSTDKGFQGWGGETCECVARLAPNQLNLGMPDCRTCKGTGKTQGDEKLLRYLYEHAHHTPFEMAGATIEVQAPIFVFREWHRHRTQSYNELSARYVQLPEMFYVPTVERMRGAAQDAINRQGSRGTLPAGIAQHAIEIIESEQRSARSTYLALIEMGVARELARIVIPTSQFSRMRASANLRNWLAFLTLRQAPNAQWEIRQYADTLAGILSQLFPRTAALHAEDRA